MASARWGAARNFVVGMDQKDGFLDGVIEDVQGQSTGDWILGNPAATECGGGGIGEHPRLDGT